ncbi:hypothetical protein J3E64_001689 [Sphingobium sp. OAS761]|uniref:hypothetical protein n=1 Tax=Sphingobium sp. OAS761 TaxID=2817901 RepID=UPI00209E0EAF|nr:hypothetical protein [Sphingobium sp. OAS761]MCP1470002.1 hypothetical protein [Sphingobium sp. OAS761]
MATLSNNSARAQQTGFCKRISTHLASALVVFCLLQIFIVARMGGSLVLHLGIIVAIAGYALAARGLERRWEMLEQGGLSQSGLTLRFRRDVLQLWSASIIGALLWIPVAIIFRAVFG